MNQFCKSMVLIGVAIGLGSVATETQASAKTPWEFRYNHEYKVRVLKPTTAYKIKLGKSTYLNRRVKKFKLKRGAVVRTWYRGVGGINWQLTGGTHEKYSRDHRYQYDVNWASKKSFKILHTYKGTDWF